MYSIRSVQVGHLRDSAVQTSCPPAWFTDIVLFYYKGDLEMYIQEPLIYMPRKRKKSVSGGGGGGDYSMVGGLISSNSTYYVTNSSQYPKKYVNDYKYCVSYTEPFLHRATTPGFNAKINGNDTHIFLVRKYNDSIGTGGGYGTLVLVSIRPYYRYNLNGLKKAADAIRWEYDLFPRYASLYAQYNRVRYCYYLDPSNPVIYRLKDTSLSDPYIVGPDFNVSIIDITGECSLTDTEKIEKIETALIHEDIPIMESFGVDNGCLLCSNMNLDDYTLLNYVHEFIGRSVTGGIVELDINI